MSERVKGELVSNIPKKKTKMKVGQNTANVSGQPQKKRKEGWMRLKAQKENS